ncbi:dihydroorotase family protein, partial [Thermoproteota archaeon]
YTFRREFKRSGITTISDMPTGNPGVLNVSLMKEKLESAKKNAYVDFALYGGAGKNNLDELEAMVKAGAIAFKTYMIGQGGYSCGDDPYILELLKKASEINAITGWHAENGNLIDYLVQELKNKDRKDPMAHVESRPNYTEYEAISKLIIFNKIAKAHLHIIHLSTKEGLEMIKAAKETGMKITTETCPHYLLLNYEYMDKVGPYGKFIPPMRSEEDRLAMWKGIHDGTINYICSDHAPHTKKSKDAGKTDIWKAGNGNPGLETMVPLMLDQVNKGNLSLQQLVKLLSENPAKVFKMYPKKGSFKIGSDADLTVVDLNKKWRITADKMYSKSADTTIYEGWEVKGKPTITIVRGKKVAEDGVVIGERGYGEYIKR